MCRTDKLLLCKLAVMFNPYLPHLTSCIQLFLDFQVTYSTIHLILGNRLAGVCASGGVKKGETADHAITLKRVFEYVSLYHDFHLQ